MRIVCTVIVVLISLYTTAQDTMFVAKKNPRNISIVEAWRKTPARNNSSFVGKYTDVGQQGPVAFHEGNFIPGSEAALKKAKQGDVLGPYQQRNADYILRFTGTGLASDSVQVAHILIAYQGSASASPEITRSKAQAKKTADSLCALINAKKVVFEDIVVQVTDDPGSKSGNLGNYGWFTRESGFIEIFKNTAFNNPVGATVVFESDFGYHIMQVKEKTKEHQCYYAWQIVRIIDTCYYEDGITKVLHVGGFPGGDSALDVAVKLERNKYASIRTPRGEGSSVMVLFDILPNGRVGGVRLSYADALSDQQRLDISALFLSLPPFIPTRTCDEVMGQTEMYFFYY